MSNRSSIVVVLLLLGLVLGTIVSVRAWSAPDYASQVSEIGPMPGPFNPNQPPDEQPRRLDSNFVAKTG